MFERFTARARRSLVIAQEQALELGHSQVGTEHLLLGLVLEGEGVAAIVLQEMGVSADSLRAELIAASALGAAEKSSKRKAFSPKLKKVLDLSLREALQFGHNYIGTEHLLLAIARSNEGLASDLLAHHAGSPSEVRSRVVAKLSGYSARGATARPARPAPSDAHTPAVEAIIPKAEELAMGAPVGSDCLLLAIIDEPDSLAARTLASFGITREAAVERFKEIGTEGTTDELPRPDPFTVEASERGLTIRIDDEELAAKIRRGELTVTFKETGT